MRIDVYLVQKGLAPTRTRAANMIKLGGVFVNGRRVDKASYAVADSDAVTVTDVIEYASLGGLKLAKALSEFHISPRGRAVDIGASNGGFTHCLLLHGAQKVYAVDVGECALPDFLLQDARVVSMPKTNARALTTDNVEGPVDFGTVDVSFISVTYILPVLYDLLLAGGEAVVLVKPQFEVGPRFLTKTGVVRDAKARLGALERVKSSAVALGFTVVGSCEVPLLFEDKNVEYLLYLRKPL